jgi:hypothetical protein
MDGIPRIARLGTVAVLVIGLVVAGSMHHDVRSAAIEVTPCTATALADASGDLSSVQDYGCVGNWAYLYATVKHLFGVTEVLEFSPDSDRWTFSDRAVVCVGAILPPIIKTRGCYSN